MNDMAEILERAAKAVFRGTMRIEFAPEEAKAIFCQAMSQKGYKNNINLDGTARRSNDQIIKNTGRGIAVEKAAAMIMGVPYVVQGKLPANWKRDFQWNGLRIEVKSVEPKWLRQKFQGHDVFSVGKHATNTAVQSIMEGRIDLILGGTAHYIEPGVYDAEFDWVINPVAFVEAWHDNRCIIRQGKIDFVKFGRNPEHRKPGASLWKGDREKW